MRLSPLLLAFAALGPAAAQPLPSPEEGSPYFQRFYERRDYGQHSQNWAATEDARGVVFVGNTRGLLEFDGREWRTLPLADAGVQRVRALAVDGTGQVYVGGTDEVGMLVPDSTGAIAYRSLMGWVPEEARGFGDVWAVQAAAEGVYFMARDRLLRWDGRQMIVWTTPTGFNTASAIDGVLYVREKGVGVRRMVDGRLQTIPGSELFADETAFAILPHPRGLLVATKTQGLFLLGGGRAVPLETDGSAYLRRHQPYYGVALANPYGPGRLYAVATLGGGVLVLDEGGRTVRVYGEDVGLTVDDLVFHVALDRQGGLWLALNDGIRRFDALSPLTGFGEEDGLLGSVYAVQRHDGALYVATSSGLFRLATGVRGRVDPGTAPYAHFEMVPGVPGPVWAMLNDGAELLVATIEGIYGVRGNAVRRVYEAAQVLALHRSPSNPDRLYVGRYDGMSVLVRGPNGWRDGGAVAGVVGEIHDMVEDRDGALWASPVGGGLLRLTFDGSGTETPRVTAFGEAEGAPTGAISVLRLNRNLALATSGGFFYLHPPEGHGRIRLVPVRLASGASPDLSGPYYFQEGARGRLWLNAGGRLHVYRPDGSGALTDVTPSGLALRGLEVAHFFEEPNGVTWIGTESGLIRYDPRVRRPQPPLSALLRRVLAPGGAALFGGAFGRGRVTVRQSEAERPELPYRQHDLRFEFAAPTFNDAAATEYQYRLDGFDRDWSAWSSETVAEYTNLSERAYRFRVRARDAQGRLSSEAVYAFTIRPPWYRTWWAYALYVVVLTVVGSAVALGRQRAQKAAAFRERLLNLRLDRTNARLGHALGRLREAERLKADLLANTSHELRTPLTAILGFSELLVEEAEGEARELAEAIHRGGERLHHTVNDLMDFAKLRADRVELSPKPVDVAALARAAVERAKPAAREKRLSVHLVGADRPVPATLDPYGLERVLALLVGNAVKFTAAGAVAVHVAADEETVTVSVADTGIGIAPEFLPHLFDEFKQASTGYERTHEGSGLGLSIVRRLVALMRGRVSVESEPGRGTTFHVCLPRDVRRRSAVEGDGAAGMSGSALAGVRVLGVEVPAEAQGALREALGHGVALVFTDNLDDAVRQAGATPFDAVVAGEPTHGAVRPATILRELPGYDRVPFVALVEGDAAGLTWEVLGYALAIPLPLESGPLLDALEGLLAREDVLLVAEPAP